MKNLPAALLLFSTLFLSLAQTVPATAPADLPDGLYAQVTAPEGVIIINLFYKKTPMTVANYVGLAEGTLGPRKGTPFFDGLIWQRVVANFVVQGGDGGRIGYSFPDEIVPGLRHDGPGTVQMANAGPDTNGSQWCMMLSDQTRLNYDHTVFGHVIRGLDVLPKIKQGDAMKVKILRIGDDAKAFKADQEAFDALVAKAKKFNDPHKDAGPDSYFDDAAGRWATTKADRDYVNWKLANLMRFTGVRVIARMYTTTPPEAQGDKLEQYIKDTAEKFQVADAGALVIYFGDQDKWIIRIGKDSQASFIAGPRKTDGTKDPVPDGWTLDQAMTQYMTLVAPNNGRGRGPATIAASAPATATAPTGRGRGRGAAGGGNIRTRLNTVLDNLIFRLEPAAPEVK